MEDSPENLSILPIVWQKLGTKLTLEGAPGLTRGVRFRTCMGGLTAFGVLARPVVPP